MSPSVRILRSHRFLIFPVPFLNIRTRVSTINPGLSIDIRVRRPFYTFVESLVQILYRCFARRHTAKHAVLNRFAPGYAECFKYLISHFITLDE